MADYQATVEVQLNGLEKLEQAEQKIKAMDGKKVKVGMDVDSSSLKKAQESLQKSLGSGVGGKTGVANGVRGYFSEYNKAIKEGYRAAEKAISAGEKTHLREKLEKQSDDYFNEAKLIRQRAQKNLKADDFRDFAIAARKANISARAESNKKQEAIAAKQVQQHFDNLDKAERAAAQRSAKEQAKIAQQTHAERQKGIEKAFNDAAKAEAAESKRIAQEQAKIDRINHAERQKELNSSFKDYDNAQIKAAKESQNRLNSYLNAARNMGDSNQANALREKAKTQVDDINAILKDNKISDAARSSIESMRDTNASNNDAKDFIQRQKNAYKDATNQSNLYAKSLSDVYKGYQKLQTAAVKARDGSAEQEYLANQAQNLRNQYEAQKDTEDYNNLSNIQKQNLAYMETAGKLQIGTAAAQKEANIQAQVSNQQFKDIYSAQKQINALEFEQSKITDKNSNAYKAYSEAIGNTAAIQAETMAKHGKLDGFEQARMDSLKQQAELQKEFFDANNVLEDSRDAQIAQNRFQANIKANSRMLKPYKQQIDDINEAYANATTKTELEDANKQAQLLFSRAAVEGKTGMTFIDQIKDGFSNFGANVVGQFMSAYAITRAVTGTVKAMYSNVAQMDSAMTELYKVTDNSDKEYADYSKGIKRTSMEIGATQTSLVQATATFARLGYNLQDSAELGKNAALFANVGDEGMTSEEAATDMVAVMKGFNIQAEDSLHIVDAFNKVGNEFAISSTGIGESLKRSGGALATANNSLEESIGLTVAANDAMQDPVATGTALKTIALRIRGMKTELADAGEDTEGMATSTAKLRDSLMQLGGVDILADGGQEFKSTYEIMGELAKNWDSISDMNRAAIIEQVAGKRGASFFSSMMTNWKDAEDAYAAAMNSAGSAEKENQSFLNSIAGKQAQFKSAFESLSNDVLNSDLVKFGVDMGTMMVKGLDNTINSVGGIGTVVTSGLGIAAVKGAANFTKTFVKNVGAKSGAKSLMGVMAEHGALETGLLYKSYLGLGSLSPVLIGGIGAAVAGTALAFKVWDKNTEQLAEAQQKLSNSLTNSNAAREQAENITSQIAKNQEEINSIEQGGINSVDEASRVEQLKNENTQLGTKLTYQQLIAKSEQSSAARAARRAMSKDDAYVISSGKSTSTFGGKIAQFLTTLGGNYKPIGFYESEADHLNRVTDNYIKTQDKLNAAMRSGNQEAVSELQDELADLNSEYSEGLNQQYEYLDAFTDKSTGKALSGFEKEYQNARNQINKMIRPTMGDNQFLGTLLGGEYKDVAKELTDLALNDGFTKGWENSSQGIRKFLNEVNSSGMDNAANKIKNLFTGIANGSTEGSLALALVEDNFESVTESINDFENRFSNTAAAAKSGFSSKGLSFGERGILGSRYDSAIGATANGFRINYSEFAKNRASAISRQRADNQSEIKSLQELGDRYVKAYQNIQDKINKANSRDARQGGLGAESIDNLKSQAAQYAQAIKTIQSSIGNLNDAQIELSGLGSKLNTYLDTASGDYESTKNLDAVAASFANLKEEVGRGWTSGAQARAFTDAWTYADMTKASNQEVSDSYAEAEANYKKFYDVTQNERSGKWESEINGTKILSELNSAGESLGKTFVGADKDIKMSTEDIANVAKVWGISESMASELVGALDGFEGHSVSISKVGKSFEELASGVTKADSAMRKYTENNEGSGYDSFESAYKDSLQKAKELEVDFSKTKYGNVNAGRNGIEWTEENFESNKSALESWGVNRDEFLGTTSSVFASSGEYGKNGGIPIAFTPLLETENGLEMLSKDTVNGYLEAIAEKSQETGEDIFDLDASGAIEGFEGIKNLVAATGEEAEKVSQQMHFVGQDGEFGVLSSEIDGYLNDIQQARHAASQAGDTEAFQALNSELARTAELKAQIDTRDSLENNLLNFDETGKGTADFRQRVDMLQDAQEAIENLEATKTVDKYAPGLLGVDAVSTAEGAVDSANQAIAQYISENGLASNLEGLSPDATQEEIADYISGMEISDLAPKLGIDLSNAEISGTDNMAATIEEQANASVASMIENANAVTKALQSNGGLDGQNYSLMMNSDGSFGIQITPHVDEAALAESTSRGMSQGANSEEVTESAGKGISSGVDKGMEQYGKKLGEIHADEQFSMGGRPELGEAVTVEADVKAKGDIDTSGINPKVEAEVEATDILTETLADSGNTIQVGAEVNNVEVPQGDAGTVNVNAVADNVEVPQGDAGTVNVDAVADNVEVPEEAGSVSVSVEAEDAPTYEDQNPQVTYGINAPPAPVYPDQNPSVNYHINAPAPPSYPNMSRTITYHINVVGTPPAYNGTANYNGTAHFGGTAYASGNWGTKKKETALVGELGMETVVYGGKFWTVGDKGAEFTSIPKGAIVFNHKQTEELFKNGKVLSGGGRGSLAHANGTAYASGTALASGNTDYDFAAIKIDRLNDEISLLADTMELFDKYAKSNAYAQQELAKVHEAILANEQAYSYYLDKANQVGLDEGHVEKVKNGTIEIESIGDEDLKKKVDDYKKWYEAAQNTQTAIVKLKKQLQEISKIKLDNIEEQFNWWHDWREAVQERTDSANELFKELNSRDSIGKLTDGINHYTNIIAENEARIKAIGKERDAQVASGEIAKYSKAWYEASQRCVEAQIEINEAKLKIEELNNTIKETNWKNFDNLLSKYDSLRNEIDTAYDLVGDMNPFRDDATMNSNGKGQLAMLQSAMQIAKQEVKNYEVAYSALNKELKKGIITQDEYNEQLYDLRKDQLDAVQSVKKYRDAILDLVKDGIEKETEAFEKLVTARQDNLQKQKEADDYARNIRDKTKDINAIEAQIAALSGDESLATRAQIRDLEAKLQEAQQDLDDTRRDHEYDTMSKAYDKELEDFKKIQDEKINDLETYLASQKTAINDALTFIRDDYKNTYDRMSSIAKSYGITLNNSILNPWTSAAKAVKAYNNAISNIKSANVKIKTNNFKGQAKSKKARGTFNASQGLTLTDEEGLEAILTKDGVLRQLDSGDTVFNAQQREMLWKISKMSPSALIRKPNIAANINSGKGMNGDININYDITVEGNADNNTVADIEDICKRAAEYTKSDMIKSFRKIGIAM